MLPLLQWVQELVAENDVQALLRSTEQLGRCYDSMEFWEAFEIMPIKSRTWFLPYCVLKLSAYDTSSFIFCFRHEML